MDLLTQVPEKIAANGSRLKDVADLKAKIVKQNKT